MAGRKITAAAEVVGNLLRHPVLSLRLFRRIPLIFRGLRCADAWEPSQDEAGRASALGKFMPGDSPNPLRSHFDSVVEGRGICKWLHYFDIYHRHLAKFVGRDVNVLEIGVYGGGSLKMWNEYFGPRCHVCGVDIQEVCKDYEDARTRVFIGDQADRAFWKRFRSEIPFIDVLIDDGGHSHEQQIVTLEEMLPHIRPGGVYLCEDVHGTFNPFTSYVHGLASSLSAVAGWSTDKEKKATFSTPTPFQAAIGSIHQYPFVTVIERNDRPVKQFAAPERGTDWPPFAGA